MSIVLYLIKSYFLTPKVNKNHLSTFYKNILIMFKGTLIAQIIAVISSLFIAKIYGSEAYGILSILMLPCITGTRSIMIAPAGGYLP